MSWCVSVWGTACWPLPLVLMLTLEAQGALPGSPRCPPAVGERCSPSGFRLDEYTFIVDGMHLLIEYVNGKYFVLKCTGNLTLDNPAMPRFDSQLRVLIANVKNCPVPHGSYSAVLQFLNVSVTEQLSLIGAGNLTAAHLSDLGDLHVLVLINAELAPRTLAAPTRLRSLLLERVHLPPDELLQLPRSLEKLELKHVGTNVTRDVLERLPALVKVTVQDSSNVTVVPGGGIRELELKMPKTHVPSALSPALRRFVMYGWAERSPAPWTSCALDTLHVIDMAAEELPARWVSDCVELRVLRVQYGRQLRELNATSLRGARRLQELYLTSCALGSLPVGLLDDAVELRVLDLSKNFLKQLPGGMFTRMHFLEILKLNKNQLTTDVYTLLKAVTSLKTLDLSNNDLRDSCGGASDTVRGLSPLENLKNLTELYLMKTNASLICRDWRDMPRLKKLDLSRNNFTSLTFADLQFHGGEAVTVNLLRNNVRRLHYTQDEYRLATGATEASNAFVILGDSLACDCGTYWAARALQERPAHLKLRASCARWQEPRDVHSVALDSLVCGAPALCASTPGCACTWRDSGVATPSRLLRVDCERAGLERLADVMMPLVSAAERERVALDDYDCQLYLAHNRIADFNATDFPKHLSVLDLRNNSLSLIREEAMRALLADEGRRVSLAHNPLACNCSAAVMLAAMSAHQAVLDYGALTCTNGSLLSDLQPAPCTSLNLAAVVVAVIAALVMVGLLAALCLRLQMAIHQHGLLPALRLRLQAAVHPHGSLPAPDEFNNEHRLDVFQKLPLHKRSRLPASTESDDDDSHFDINFKLPLHKRGWLLAHNESDDDNYRFDVFLSFSHGDERFVRDELVARLESGLAPYRLCVHYRDWVPGGWIPAQIAASVRASRRTVVVVSEHFLRSAWARAEFQEAYAQALRDARPRLVVVLLGDPATLPLDKELRCYLATNTYVRWGDPWFWQKLRLALPRGRSPEPAALPERVLSELPPAVAPAVPPK